MLRKLMQEAKGNRREYIASLMKQVTERTPAFGGVEVTKTHGNALSIKISKS